MINSCKDGANIGIVEVENGSKLISIDASWFEPPKDFQGQDVQYIPLETNSQALIGTIDELKVVDDLVFVLDKNVAKALLIYRIDGSFVNKIAASGQGPEEVNRINDFTINREEEEILISDLGKRRIYVYNFAGDLLRVERNDLWYTSLEWINKGLFLYYLSHYSVDENNGDIGPLVVLGGIDGRASDEYFKIDSRQANMTIVERFHLSHNGQEVLFTKKFDENIYSMNKNSELVSVAKVDFGHLGIEKDYRELKVNNYRVFENESPFAQLRNAYSTSSSYALGYTNPVKMNGLQIHMQAIIPKNKGEGFLYIPTNKPDSTGVMLPSIIASDDKYFYGFYDADEFIAANDENEEVILKKYPLQKLQKVNETDNPILVKIKVRDEK
ncbi:6-bladed beta-propeller [Roseivirga sp.]|uniref:6-bladed beta-propeller n=1 Tax=Roseivirga sp. TaxID=1964215 RepID=UPI003B8C027E